jgi:monofunctional biosynthetic peptidoglycan transglycosylase
MSPRIEPTLGPPVPGSSELRPEPVRRVLPPAPQAPERHSILGMLFMSLLLAAAALVLAIVALRWLPPPTSSYMLQSPVKPVQYRWVPAGDIADTARRAVVAAEDQKFWTHHGFDMEAIEQAQQYNSNPHHHRRGASTISQQTAKNLFLWPGGYVRKGIEAGLTVLIEKLWGKNRILDVYLNIAEFGPGIYGVEAASQSFFGKPASRLSAEEAARLAAVLPNPRHWSVRDPGPYVQARTAWILGQMGYPSPGTPQEEPEPPAAGTPEALPDGGDRDEALPEPAPRAEPGQGGAEAPAAEAPPPAADKPPG